MALIKCPDCGKDISDMAPACIHCGRPIKDYSNRNEKTDICIIHNKEYDLSKYKERILKDEGAASAKQICFDMASEIDGLSVFGAAELSIMILKTGVVPERFNAEEFAMKFKAEDLLDRLPRCPRCGSTAVTTGERGYSILWGFAGSGRTVNRCGRCGHKWAPRG